MPYGTISDEIKAMDRAELEEYVSVLEYLDGSRERLIEALPDCPSHGGGCIPFALAWIAKAKAAGVELTDEENDRSMWQSREILRAAIDEIASR
jgi:hypothetical protein